MCKSKFLLIMMIVVGLVSSASAAIELDAVSSAVDGGGADMLSWSHTIGSGSDRVLIVAAANEDSRESDMAIVSVKYNGVNMTYVSGSSKYLDPVKSDLYYMLDADLPSAGTYTVEITYASGVSDLIGGAISLNNTAQRAPDTVVTNSEPDSTTISTNITTQTDGSWVVDVVAHSRNGTLTPTTSGMVKRWEQDSGAHMGAGSTKPVATAGATTMSWELDGSADPVVHSVAEVAIAGSSPPPPPVPVADFSGSPTSGEEPLTVDFTDLSTGDITSWDWTFGDGGSSTQQNPSYTYNNDGTYTVSLTVTGPGGSDTETKTNYITVNPSGPTPPNAGFTGSPTSGPPPLMVNFTDTSTGNITSWDWTFGDGGTSTVQNPSHEYQNEGTYTVSLTVDGPDGSDIETKTNYISVTTGGEDVWTNYKAATSGLNDNNIRAVMFHNGLVWIGSIGGGVNTFDGTTWGSYKTGQGLVNNAVWDFDVDAAGNIWIATNGGVSKFDGTNFTNYTTGNSGLNDNNCRAIAVDTDGTTVWIATIGGGVNKFDGTNWSFYNKNNSPLPHNRAWGVAVDSAGVKWIATMGGAARFDGTNWEVYDSELPSDDVYYAEIASDGSALFATLKGIGRYDGTTWTTYEEENGMPEDNTRSACTDSGGILWAGTSAGGACKYDGTEWTQYKTTTSGIVNNYVWDIDFESPTKVWIGTNGGLSLLEIGGGAPSVPVAAFSGSPTSGDVPLTVTFTDASTGDITSWDWTFGDGGTSTLQNPSHTYEAEGTYTVSLTVTGPGGSDTETKVDYISATAAPPPTPVPNFTADVTEGLAPLAVTFTDQSTGCIDTWKYDFDGDGDDDWSKSSHGNPPPYTYETPGVYTVSLKVRDCYTGDYYTETKVDYITVNAPVPPTAAFSAIPTSGSVPQTVSFTDESTGDISTWNWTFGDGGTSTEQNPDHLYNTEGTYTVTLDVNGPGGFDSLTKVDYIDIGPPQPADANFTADPTVGFSPLDVQFTDLSTGSVTEWSWDFGDGGTSTVKNPVHTYSVGTYTVTLDVNGPVSGDSMTKVDYIVVEQAPPGGTGLTIVDSPDDLTNTHPHLWVRGYGPDNGLWAKAQTTHSEIWTRLSDTAPTGPWGGITRSNGQQLMRAAMAFVISKDAGFGNHCQDAILSMNGYAFGTSIEDLECFYGYCLAYDALVDDPETTWLTAQEKADALSTMSTLVQTLNSEPGATWRVRPTHNLQVLRCAAHAVGLYNLRGEAGYESVFNTSRQYALDFHMERVNGLCTNSVIERNGPRPLDGFPYEGPNYGAYQASRALIHRHVLEYHEYPNPDTILDENKSGFFQNYNLAWMGIMVPGLSEWADVAYRGKHGILQGVRFYSAINKALGDGIMAGVGEWFHNTIVNSTVGTADRGWWQGWEMMWYDPSITALHPDDAGIPPYVHCDDAEYHSYRDTWDVGTPGATLMYFRNSAHNSHNYWDEGHSGEGITYECTVQTSSHDGADNGHFGIFRNGTWIAYNESPQGDTDMHNCLLIDGLGQCMDGAGRGYEFPQLAGTDVVGIVDSDYGHALDGDIGAAYNQVTDYHRYFFVIRANPMYAIVVDELEGGHTVDFLCHNEGTPSKQAEDLYTSGQARYQVLYPESGYTSSPGAEPITITTTSPDIAFLVHTNPSASVTKSYSGGVLTANIGSDMVVYNSGSGSYDNGTISGNAKLFAEKSGGAIIFKATSAQGSQYGLSCSSLASMSVSGREATVYIYGGTQSITITSPYGTDTFTIPGGKTVKRTLTGVSAEPPVADFFAMPTTGWDLYLAPEFVSLSTGWITDYLWEFGDGATSTEMAPHHKYGIPGVYTVKLTVTGPGGENTKVKQNLITVKSFASGYDYPDYLITEATQAAFDAALDAIEASQSPGKAPGDPNWCGGSWCNLVQHGGGGRILFDASIANSTIYIDWDSRVDERNPSGNSDAKRDFFGDNLIIDGEDKNITFYYNGAQPCGQVENQSCLRIHGNDNIVRSVTWERFPDGLHMRGGQRNLIENVDTSVICEDAATFNGSGNRCIECVARDCTYGSSTDKTFMISGGGSLSSAVICGMHSTGGNQPIRVTGGGMYIVRNSTFQGHSQGPRFGGEGNLIIFENNLSTTYGIDDIGNGVRISDKASAWIRNNTMENCEDYGIYAFNGALVIRAENNTIVNCAGAGVWAEDQGAVLDLGGGLVDVFRNAEPWLPAASYPTTDPAVSIGRNTLTGSGAAGVDVVNNAYDITPGDILMMAEHNFWDHTTVSGVETNDIDGNIDVDPLGVSIE